MIVDASLNNEYNPLIEVIKGALLMSELDVEIVKICKHHGPLTADLVFVYKRSDRPTGVKKQCRLCKLEKDRRYNAANKEKKVAATMKWKEENKEHVNAYMRDYRALKSEKPKNASQRWKERNPQKLYDAQIKRLYGVTGEEYAKMLHDQKGLCAICNQPETRSSRTVGEVCRLALDHDHDTGMIRGLLCHSCNTGIGKFKESPELLMSALAYLERYKT